MKLICFTIFTLFCTGLSAQSSDQPTTGVQPEFGFVLDSVFTSHEFDGTSANLQMAEMSISSRIDPLARAFAIIEFPDADEVEVPEAVLIFDGFDNGWEIRAGRMNMDLGKLNTVHSHDLAMPFGDPVRAALFGGHLNGTGLETHKWFALGDTPMRFSLGAWADAGAHSHGDHGAEEELEEGRQQLNDWSFTGRLSSQLDLGDNGWWQWGVSYFGNAHGMSAEWENELDPSDGSYASGETDGLGMRTLGFDLSFRDGSLTDESWNGASLEYWDHQQDHVHAEGAAQEGSIERSAPQGAWLVAEHGFSSDWSMAAHMAWWEGEVDEELDVFKRYGLAVNRNFSEFNRLRVAVEQIEDPAADDSWAVSFQWSLFMGKHRHGLDW
ncbi:MAG: hypothetical protein H8E25_14080 [Planctomycetes bacterium]|nr:hypothetical protein [Planctomycetota bacterium]